MVRMRLLFCAADDNNCGGKKRAYCVNTGGEERPGEEATKITRGQATKNEVVCPISYSDSCNCYLSR